MRWGAVVAVLVGVGAGLAFAPWLSGCADIQAPLRHIVEVVQQQRYALPDSAEAGVQRFLAAYRSKVGVDPDEPLAQAVPGCLRPGAAGLHPSAGR